MHEPDFRWAGLLSGASAIPRCGAVWRRGDQTEGLLRTDVLPTARHGLSGRRLPSRHQRLRRSQRLSPRGGSDADRRMS